MNLRIQTIERMAVKKDNAVLSLRLKEAESQRFWRVMDQVKARNPYVDKSDVIRELIGLEPATALTEDEIKFFRMGKTASATTTKAFKKGIQLKSEAEILNRHSRKVSKGE